MGLTKTTHPVFVTIRPEGFYIGHEFRKTLTVVLERESPARKLWRVKSNKRILACFSSNGWVSNHGKECRHCSNRNDCHKKLRLYFECASEYCCLELPATSYANYRDYKEELRKKELCVTKIQTYVSVIGRGYWGEVCFRADFNMLHRR